MSIIVMQLATVNSIALELFNCTDVPRCDVHLVNDGVTITDNGDGTGFATFEFEGTGPDEVSQITNFRCEDSGGRGFPTRDCESFLR